MHFAHHHTSELVLSSLGSTCCKAISHKPTSAQHTAYIQCSQLVTELYAADYYNEKSGKLGPDPLRQDADSERLWDKLRTSKKPVGGILMDQTAVAGIGNIYRAEILFKVDIRAWMQPFAA